MVILQCHYSDVSSSYGTMIARRVRPEMGRFPRSPRTVACMYCAISRNDPFQDPVLCRVKERRPSTSICKQTALLRIGISQQTRDVGPVLFYCWDSVCDAGPTVKQHWLCALVFAG